MLHVGGVPTVGADEARLPNVVVIFIDDMGYGDIGPFGVRGTRRRTWIAWPAKG